MRRRLVTLLAVLLATGCGTVPTSGPIRSSNQGGSQLDQCQVDIDAQPPQRGASAEQIVNGFLEAMGDSSTFEVARQYLTEEAAGKWRPERQMVVYDDPPNRPALGQAPNGNLRLDAIRIATVDARGSWRPAPKDQELKFDFDLDPVNGEWRIAKAPEDGVYIKANLLEINYVPVNLYYFTPALDRLIPDPVYLPRYCSHGQRATRLVEALLAGPTDRLGNSVPNLVPQDTKVNVSVPVDASSVATVALNEPPSKLGPDLRKRLAAQIAWTLPTRAVRLTANGAPLVDGGQEEVSRSDFDEFDPVPSGSNADRLFVPAPAPPPNGKGIWQVNGLDGTAQPDQRLVGGQLSDEPVESFAVEPQGQRAAVVRPDDKVAIGQLLGAGEASKRYIETQGRVLRPSFDAQGNLWIVDRADGTTARIRRVSLEVKEEPKPITVVGLARQRIRVLRVAPDGVRVLLVVGDDLRRQVTIGRLTSTGTPTQLKLEGFSPLHLQFSDVVDAGWSEPAKITVLGTGQRSDVGQNQPLEVNVDGSVQRPVLGRERFNLTDLAVSPATTSLLVVRDEDRDLHAQSKELSWNQLLTTGQPVYPG